jgi:tight adherence protein C
MNFLMIALLFGFAVSALLYSVVQVFREVPKDDRTYLDQPPRFFKLIWPLILLLSAYMGGVLSKAYIERIGATLRRSGLEYSLTPQQFFSGKLLSALFAFLICWYCAVLLEAKSLLWPGILGLFGFFYPDIWLRDKLKARNLQMLKALPFFLDVVTLSVEAGLNLSGALQQAVAKCPPSPLSVEINRVLRDVRAGKPRLDCLRELAERLDFAPISSLVSALVQGEITGSSLGPILRAQSEQRRSERFQRAEKLAMEAPVKMLGPLIMFIFPCTFIVIGFPIVMKFLASGL